MAFSKCLIIILVLSTSLEGDVFGDEIANV